MPQPSDSLSFFFFIIIPPKGCGNIEHISYNTMKVQIWGSNLKPFAWNCPAVAHFVWDVLFRNLRGATLAPIWAFSTFWPMLESSFISNNYRFKATYPISQTNGTNQTLQTKKQGLEIAYSQSVQ